MNQPTVPELRGKLMKIMKVSGYGYYPVGMALGLITPDNILDHRWARAFTDFVADLIPFVAMVGRINPGAPTQFIAAVIQVLAIWVAFLGVCYLFVADWDLLTERYRTVKSKFIAVLGAPIFVSAPYLLFFCFPKSTTPSNLNWKEAAMVYSKWVMGFYGSIIIGLWIYAAFSIFLILVAIRSLRSGERK